MSEWRPIETAPSGKFLAWLPITELPWPAWREADGKVYSNAHGLLNEADEVRRSPVLATHWMPLPAPP